MKKLSLLLVVLTTTSFAQTKRPLADDFYAGSSLSSAKSNLKANREFVEKFTEKNSATMAEFEKHQKNVKELETLTAKIDAIPEKKRTKQEKAFAMMDRCMNDLFNNKKVNADSVGQCAYISNVDPRLFRKSPKGKILGESSEIQAEGDEISKIIDRLSKEVPSKETFVKFKELKNGIEHKAHLEKTFASAEANIKQLEKDVADRKALDKLVAEELMDCKKEISVPDLDFQKLSVNGSAELAKDLMETVTQDKDISTNSYLNISGLSPCKAFDELRAKGYCLEKKKKSRDISGDCESCHAKMGKMQGEELAAHLSAIVQNEKEDCSEKKSISSKLGYILCDNSVTNEVRYEKDKNKQILKLRKLVATNVAQGIALGKKQNDIYGSIVGMKNEDNVCKYQVRDLSSGKSKWVPEASVLEGLQELTQIIRR